MSTKIKKSPGGTSASGARSAVKAAITSKKSTGGPRSTPKYSNVTR